MSRGDTRQVLSVLVVFLGLDVCYISYVLGSRSLEMHLKASQKRVLLMNILALNDYQHIIQV